MIEQERGEDELGTCGEKGMTTAPASTSLADETPSPRAHPFLPPFAHFQQHNVAVLQSRGKVTAVLVVVYVGVLDGMSGEVGTVPVLH